MSYSYTSKPSVQTRRGNNLRGRGTMYPTNHRVNSNSGEAGNVLGGRPRDNVNENQILNRDTQDSYGQSQGPSSGHASGYTVIPPNERNRRKVLQIAQSEAQDYEQYKQSKSGRPVHYVGTTGGSGISEEVARRRQAEMSRTQKFDRMKRQEEYRNNEKKREEAEIEKSRAEARRKAEQNALRDQQRIADPEDLRRKRENFLKQLEKKS